MAELTKQALIVENNQSFPNNNAGAITPSILRNFNTDIIDSTVNQAVYTADSGSWNEKIDGLSTGSALITASVDFSTITFTKGDGSQFDLVVTASVASVDWDNITDKPAGLVSGSSQVVDILTSVNSFTASQETKDSTLASYTGSVDTKFSTIGTQSGSWDNTSLNQFSASQESKDVTLASYTGSVNTKFSTIGSQSGSWDNTALNQFSASQESKDLTLATYTGSIDTKFSTLGTQTGSYATTGSNQFNGSQSISGSITLSGSVNNVNYIDFNTASLTPAWKSGRVFWDNTDGALGVYNAEADITLQVGQEQWVRVRNNTGSPIVNGAVVRLVGAQGDNPLVVLAQSVQMSGSVATDNQVLGIATHTIETGTNGYVTTLGNVRGLNTNAYAEGDILWVSTTAGQLTNVVPTAPYERIPVATVVKVGPGGSGIVYVAPIPPIDFASLSSVAISGNYGNNDTWLYSTSSLTWQHVNKNSLGFATTGSNTFTGNQTFQNISAVSASFQYVQSVTGSAVIIGNSFVVVNNDTPTAPYGGLSVYDSGSVLPTTSSLVWDGNTNDWKYSYDVGAGHDAAVMLFGPGASSLATTPYPTANKLQKGTGGHHLEDSTIFDDGTTVSVGANLSVTGSIQSNGTSVLLEGALNNLNSFTSSQESKDSTLASYTGSVNTQLTNLSTSQSIDNDKFTTIGTQSGSWENIPLTSLNSFTQSQEVTNTQLLNASSSFESKFAYIGTQSGSWSGGGGADLTSLNAFTSSQQILNAQFATTGSNTFEGTQTINGGLSVSTDITADRLVLTGGTGVDLIITGSGIITNTLTIGPIGTGDRALLSNLGISNVNQSTNDEIGFTNNGINYGVSGWDGPSIYGNDPTDSYPAFIGFQNKADWTDGTITVLKPLDIIGSLTVSGSINNSVHTLSITSNTASIDASVGTTFVLSLVDATNTRLEVSNTTYGQTLNLLVSQSALGTGTLSFGENFYEPSGSFYSASAVASAKDIITLATFVEPNVVYVASIKNLIV